MANGPSEQERTYQAAINGLGGHLPAGTKSLSLDGEKVDVGDLIQELQDRLDEHKEARLKQEAARAAVHRRDANEASGSKRLKALRVSLNSLLGSKNPVLREFGFMPEKDRTQLTTEQQFARVQKQRATREARGTKGKKQKSKIKGTPKPPAP